MNGYKQTDIIDETGTVTVWDNAVAKKKLQVQKVWAKFCLD